jgi:hypothetical protein
VRELTEKALAVLRAWLLTDEPHESLYKDSPAFSDAKLRLKNLIKEKVYVY